MTVTAPSESPAAGLDTDWPAFIREFDSTLAVHSQYVFHGNIRDQFVAPGEPPRLTSFTALLWEGLRANGYQCLICYDTVGGITVHPLRGPGAAEASEAAARALGGPDVMAALNQATVQVASAPDLAKAIRERFRQLRQCIEAVASNQQYRAAFLIDYASHLARNPSDLGADERGFFLACAKLSATAPRRPGPAERQPLYNPVIWLADGERDLPTWLTAGNSHIRTISVPAPDLGIRLKAARLLAARLDVPDPDGRPETAETLQAFAAHADGLSLAAMQEITRLAQDRQIGYRQLPDAIRVYKLGVVEDPWRRSYLRDRIRERQDGLNTRVIGQDAAVTKTLDILKRASLGLSGAQASSSATRPRGVLFFAGPTGVGKTELAKAVAALIFGDKDEASAFLRFDMSEFSAENSADRLIGAPPGYVGFEAGGELTNAVRQNPFRVILFDEIEKAHHRILDKFLQILDDGRLTDGQGQTTYFSECVIIFTSNLGIQEEDPSTQKRTMLVDSKTSYADVCEKVAEGIRNHFLNKLGRPELLNRLGGNIVIFDFIRPPWSTKIFDKMLNNVLERVLDEHHVTITLDPGAYQCLHEHCTLSLENGGRGIGNELESLFINPLARALFDCDPAPGGCVTVTTVDPGNLDIELR